jgi:site-specific recombinase XerD
MGTPEVEAYLTHLANARGVSASTHNQALSALLFLYRDVLDVDLPWLSDIGRPAQRQRLPVILTVDEVPCALVAFGPRSGIRRRHHLFEQRLQRGIKRAAQEAGIVKPVSVHSLRHAFATTLLQSGYDIRTVQELLGHADASTTMIYTHVLKVGGGGVRSPLDLPVYEAARHAPTAQLH